MTNLLIRFTAMLLLFVSANGAQAQTPPPAIRVLVYGTYQGNDIIYNYKLINNSVETLQNFVIGSTYNTLKAYEYPQLKRKPVGWSYGKTGETGTEIILAPGSTRQPPNWTANLYGQEGTGYYYLEWETMPDGQGTAILPGQSLAGFSVTVPLYDLHEFPRNYYNAGQVLGPTVGRDDDMYLRSSFKVKYWDVNKNDIQNIWGVLEREDTTPPTLSITLSPSTLWPPNEKMVPITATITVKDDYAPQPVIKLLSITANEPLDKDDIKAQLFTDDRQFQLKAEREGKNKAGRIYTVTYMARDGSGNKTIASATVIVPHDQGK